MKRIDVVYDGRVYTISGREIAEVQQEVVEAVSSGTPHWLTVNSGEGRYAETYLLVTASTSIAVAPVQIDEVPPDQAGAIPFDEVRVGSPPAEPSSY